MSLSSITISGTIKTDPQKRFTPTNISVTNFVIEVTYMPRGMQAGQPRSPESRSIRINAWRDLAEECERTLKAGDKVLVVGRAQVNVYTTQEGKRKKEIEIDASSVVKLNELISIQLPEKSEEQEEKEKPASLKIESKSVEEISSVEEALISTEEIPF